MVNAIQKALENYTKQVREHKAFCSGEGADASPENVEAHRAWRSSFACVEEVLELTREDIERIEKEVSEELKDSPTGPRFIRTTAYSGMCGD